MPFHNQPHYLPENPFPAAVTWAQTQAKEHQKKEVCHNFDLFYGATKLKRTYDALTKTDCIVLSIEDPIKRNIRSKRDIIERLDEIVTKLVEKGFISLKEKEEIDLSPPFDTKLRFSKRNGPSLEVGLKDNERVEFVFQGDNLDKLMTDLTNWLANIPQVQSAQKKSRL